MLFTFTVLVVGVKAQDKVFKRSLFQETFLNYCSLLLL
jgi:hypothetical protein